MGLERGAALGFCQGRRGEEERFLPRGMIDEGSAQSDAIRARRNSRIEPQDTCSVKVGRFQGRVCRTDTDKVQ
ncbi:hypothetical protein ACLOJK_010139 [Asimina triloba]